MTGEGGSSLLGTLAIGFVVVLLVGQSLVTIGRLSSAATTAEETARYAATWAARHGTVSHAERIAMELAPDATVNAAETADGYIVVVEIEVPLIGPEGSPLRQSVSGRADVPVSEFRSAP